MITAGYYAVILVSIIIYLWEVYDVSLIAEKYTTYIGCQGKKIRHSST